MTKLSLIEGLVKEGVNTSGEIAKRLECSPTQVVSLLGYLQRKGRVLKTGIKERSGAPGKAPFLYAVPDTSPSEVEPPEAA